MTAKKYFFLTSLPRCGNTFLSILLNQHKKIKVGANSILPEIFNSLFLLKRDEKFLNFPDHHSLDNVIKNVFDSYYKDWDCDYIIDRSSWGGKFNLDIVNTLFKKNKFIILKRPMVEIMNSFVELFEEKDRKKYIDFLFKENSVLTNNIKSIKNILTSEEDSITINYVDLVKDHKRVISNVFNFLNINEKPLDKYKLEQYNINGVVYEDGIKDMHKIKQWDEINIINKNQFLSKDIVLKCKEIDKHLWS